MHLIDQVHLVATARGRVLDVIQQLTGILHLGPAGRIHLDQVDKTALADLHAGITSTTGLGAHTLLAIQATGQYPGNGGLAHTACTGEQVRVVQTVLVKRVHQGPGNVFLPDQFLERPGAVFACENLVTHYCHNLGKSTYATQERHGKTGWAQPPEGNGGP